MQNKTNIVAVFQYVGNDGYTKQTFPSVKELKTFFTDSVEQEQPIADITITINSPTNEELAKVF
jgi:subtilisin-like proprotein convertase family protein